MCRRKLSEKKLTVIDKIGISALCCVTCNFCKSSVLLSISPFEGGVAKAVGVLSDVTPKDAHVLSGRVAVSQNDVRNVHRYFERKKRK